MEGPWTRAGALAGLGALLVGVLALVVAVLAWTLPQQPAESQQGGKGLDVEIPPSSYDVTASWWENHGPIYEADSGLYPDYGVTHAHAYGNSFGRFVYRVDLGEVEGGQVELRARLSADTQGYSDPERRHTDVTVIVNGQPLPVRQVIHDDGRGAHYTWRFDAAALRRGENTIEFAVEENAESANGLAIYGSALAPEHADEHITLRGR